MYITATNMTKGLKDAFEENNQNEILSLTSVLTVLLPNHMKEISDIDRAEYDEMARLDKEIARKFGYSMLNKTKPDESISDICKIINDVWIENLKNVPENSKINIGDMLLVTADTFDLFFKDDILKVIIAQTDSTVLNAIQIDANESEKSIESMVEEVIEYSKDFYKSIEEKKEKSDLGLLN